MESPKTSYELATIVFLVIIPFYRRGSWGPERWSTCPRSHACKWLELSECGGGMENMGEGGGLTRPERTVRRLQGRSWPSSSWIAGWRPRPWCCPQRWGALKSFWSRDTGVMRMRFEEEESSTRWSRFRGGVWKWGPLWGTAIADWARSDEEIRPERPLGLIDRVGPGRPCF